MLLGTYRVADLQALSSSDMLATSLPGNFLHLVKADEVREFYNLSAKWKRVISVCAACFEGLCYENLQT